MKKFIGREREIKELDRCMASEQSEFVILALRSLNVILS